MLLTVATREIMNKPWAFDTLKVKAGYDSHDHGLSVSVPIYQTASYELESAERARRLNSFQESGHVYSRLSNPTTEVLEKRLAALDYGSAAIAVASGMAAVTYSLFNIAEDGGRILVTANLYGGTFNSFKKLYPKFGIHIDVIQDASHLDVINRQITPQTKAIFLESISNPDAELYDTEAIAAIAHEHGIPLVVDNTVATPYLFNPLEHGADVVVYSLTKGISGHGNSIGGAIVENGKFDWGNGNFPQFTDTDYNLRDIEGNARSILQVFPQTPFTARIRSVYVNFFGAELNPFGSYLTLLGLDTISERLSKQVNSTELLVGFLENHPDVEWVHYPKSRRSKYQNLAERYFPRGAGAVFSFGFKGTEEERDRFLNATEIFSYQANIGDVHSLIINIYETTHREYTPQEKKVAGLTPNTIRLSIGLEDVNDLIADLDQAFKQAKSCCSQQNELESAEICAD
jgi:O-acetylhomoserine (thiol)-lyase